MSSTYSADGVRLGVGGELLGVYGWGDAIPLGGKGWGIDAWSVVVMVDGSSPADECGLSSALVLSQYFPYPLLSLYFPYPLDQLSPSHTSRTPSCLLFPTIMILVHPPPDAESCCSVSHPVAGC